MFNNYILCRLMATQAFLNCDLIYAAAFTCDDHVIDLIFEAVNTQYALMRSIIPQTY